MRKVLLRHHTLLALFLASSLLSCQSKCLPPATMQQQVATSYSTKQSTSTATPRPSPKLGSGTLKKLLTWGLLCTGTAAASPNLMPTEVPPQTANVASLFAYEVPVDQLFHFPADSSFTLQAHLQGENYLPDWLTFNEARNTLFGYPKEDDMGNYDLALTASDTAGTTSSNHFTLQVNAKAQEDNNTTSYTTAGMTGSLTLLLAALYGYKNYHQSLARLMNKFRGKKDEVTTGSTPSTENQMALTSLSSLHEPTVPLPTALRSISQFSSTSMMSLSTLMLHPHNVNVEAVDRVGVTAEWCSPKVVLVHTPSIEEFLAVIYPRAALYERAFDVRQAATEHKYFRGLLEKSGAKVYNIIDLFLKDAVDKNFNFIEGAALEELRTLARRTLRIQHDFEIEHNFSYKAYKKSIIKNLSPDALLKILLLQPTIYLAKERINTKLSARYELAPLMNIMFLRDQLITTKKGIVLGRMNSPQRSHETKLIKFALKKLGITPIYEVTEPGRLEGGDLIMAGDTAFIGQGLRTSAAGVKQLLANQVFGTPYVAVVKDPWQNQQEMHLDTYFNIMDKRLAVLSEWRLKGYNPTEKTTMPTLVDVYQKGEKGYSPFKTNLMFYDYLTSVLNFQVLPVSQEDQALYGINFLTIGPKRIIGVEGVSKEYKQRLEKANVEATWVNFDAVTGAYGAAHCITQPIVRA